MPLSIAQRYGRKTLLTEAGFNQLNDQLFWSAEHTLGLQVKAKAIDVGNR
ncbi:MAG: hypothetical protein ACI8R9_002189 [Paraglaciecola sp.]|jgi:hypothetical protein